MRRAATGAFRQVGAGAEHPAPVCEHHHPHVWVGVSLIERYLEPSWALELARHVGAQRHFQELCRGVVKSPVLAFYSSAVLLLLFLTTRSLQSRSWR